MLMLEEIERRTATLWEATRSPQFDWTAHWGSCQYFGAEATFNVLMELYKKVRRNRKRFLRKLAGFAQVVTVPVSKEEAVEKIKVNLLEYLDEMKGPEDSDQDLQWLDERRAEANSVTTVVGGLNVLRDMSWDLWGAAPYIASLCGITVRNAVDTSGQGPIYNIMAQNENGKTGLCCALLVIFGFVPMEEAANTFGGFDT
jgi:hypothetical protein